MVLMPRPVAYSYIRFSTPQQEFQGRFAKSPVFPNLECPWDSPLLGKMFGDGWRYACPGTELGDR
jgi:hypothetical protein